MAAETASSVVAAGVAALSNHPALRAPPRPTAPSSTATANIRARVFGYIYRFAPADASPLRMMVRSRLAAGSTTSLRIRGNTCSIAPRYSRRRVTPAARPYSAATWMNRDASPVASSIFLCRSPPASSSNCRAARPRDQVVGLPLGLTHDPLRIGARAGHVAERIGGFRRRRRALDVDGG